MDQIHQKFMRRCFDLAVLAENNVGSNPQVGAVLVHENRIIGEGYHRKFGDNHAEVNAITNAIDKYDSVPQDAQLYVSLEPCCIHRKTPACTNLIIKHNIKKVYFSVLDPNPEVRGKSVVLLKSEGIQVQHGILADEGRQLIQPFLANLAQRPYVILKYAQSSDAYIGKRGKEISISNNYSKILSHKWRSQVDGILVGYQTALIDDPKLNTRMYHGDSPMRIVLDPKSNLPNNLNLCSDDGVTLFITDNVEKPLSLHKEYISISESESHISDILKLLFQRGISRLLIEGGARTIQKFINSNNWDEARIITSIEPLSSGIRAPYLSGKIAESYTLQKDTISIIYNDKVSN